MKCELGHEAYSCDMSPPSRGAWIEIYHFPLLLLFRAESPPSRGAWIEMCTGNKNLHHPDKVAPLAGGVD